MKIAVFCSANKHIDPDFFSLTEEFGKHVWLLLFLKRGKKEPNETMWKKYPSTNILIFDG